MGENDRMLTRRGDSVSFRFGWFTPQHINQLYSVSCQTLSVLWGVMNGDNLHAILTAAQSTDVLVAHLYMYDTRTRLSYMYIQFVKI